MQITDPIADLLTRIRNANAAKHETVSVPASNMKKAICQILLDEGYVKDVKVEKACCGDKKFDTLVHILKERHLLLASDVEKIMNA